MTKNDVLSGLGLGAICVLTTLRDAVLWFLVAGFAVWILDLPLFGTTWLWLYCVPVAWRILTNVLGLFVALGEVGIDLTSTVPEEGRTRSSRSS